MLTICYQCSYCGFKFEKTYVLFEKADKLKCDVCGDTKLKKKKKELDDTDIFGYYKDSTKKKEE